MDIKRNGSRPSVFEPGARSARHTHPLGQTLIVTSGLGWTQCEGRPIEEIRPGDVHLGTRREALARRDSDNRDDPYRYYGIAQRQERRLDGKRDGITGLKEKHAKLEEEVKRL
jgi:hypothetical protein